MLRLKAMWYILVNHEYSVFAGPHFIGNAVPDLETYTTVRNRLMEED